ncbi:MAG: hypothetical protein KIT09_33300 [Bryobacteraceae bacterium]|nr:hypothetical protein [Bryobacteraceae bacterium]
MNAGSALRSLPDLGASALALVWRRLMCRTRFVAVTGSYGKTTATECLRAILAAHFPTSGLGGGANNRRALATNVLRTRWRHRFAVIEVGTKLPGALWRASLTIDPDIVVVLAVGKVHSNNFPDLDAVAAEKAQLLRRIRGSRIAVLNADDPRVKAMAARCSGRVLTFGQSEDNDLWIDAIESRWPERLRFRAHAGASLCLVRTSLVGEHWAPAVAGALLAAMACGVSLEAAAAAVETVAPVTGRMQPALLPNGAVFLRDEYNESLSTMDAALRVLGQGVFGRRILVAGDVYDSPDKEKPRLEDLGRRAARAADIALFIGRNMRHAARSAVAAGMKPGSARAFRDFDEASWFLRSELRSGDFVLLRGCSQWHLERVYFSQLGTIQCHLKKCPIVASCDSCRQLGLEPGAHSPPAAPAGIEGAARQLG